MRVASIINQKGGVAKTTTAVNLSAGLALQGKKVLLIDLDPQGHATQGIGIERGSYRHTIGNVLVDKLPMKGTILKTGIDGLDVVPSHIHLSRAEQGLLSAIRREQILHDALCCLGDAGYDYCVMDTPPTLGVLTVNAIYASDYFVVPCEISRHALDGFADLYDTLDQVKGKNFFLDNSIRILLTKYDIRNSISIGWALKELEPYEKLIFKTQIRRSESLNQSQMAARSIYSFDSRCHGAQDYLAFTIEFMGLCPSK